MHTTSFNHKYQVGDQVWVLGYGEPEYKTIKLIKFKTDGEVNYGFELDVPWGYSEDKIYNSLIEAKEAYVEQEKRSLKVQIEIAKGNAERSAKWFDDLQEKLEKLEALEN
jgi:hypothetical protein